MGGKVFKEIPNIRMNSDDMEGLKDKIVNKIKVVFEKLDMPLYVEEKKDHGDLDLLGSTTHFRLEELKTMLYNEFNITHFSKNSNILSVAFPIKNEYFQVDFIVVNPFNYESTYYYLSYNDLSNFLGRIATRVNLKLGMNGLAVPIVYKGNSLDDVFLSADYMKNIEHLGYDSVRYQKGFKTFNEMFEFVTSSPYFKKDIFLFENSNSIDKKKEWKKKSI